MFIVLEGLDGAGKTTQINLLQDYFQQQGVIVKNLHFPRFDAPVFGELIAKFLRGDFGSIESVHPMLVALLFAEDRKEAAVELKSWLDSGYCVIADRYIYSNVAFQCAKVKSLKEREGLRNWIIETEYNSFGIPKPTLNLFLDVPIDFVDKKLKEERIGDDRDYLQGKKDIHEASINFQKEVREIYLAECSRDNGFCKIDCSGENGEILPAEKIFSMIKMHFEKVIQ